MRKQDILIRKKDGLSAEEAAVAWFVRLRGEPVTDGDRAAFEAWRAIDPAHADAYRVMERLWTALGQIDRRLGGRNEAESTRGFSPDWSATGGAAS